jgi:integrase
MSLDGRETAGKIIEAGPKTASSVRKVALPQFLVRELSGHIARWSDPEGWIFPSPEGGPLRRTNWRRRFWLPAVEASVGAPLRYHDLRHSHAAILIAQGEHVRVIADRLGHANPMVTMTTYAHLFDGLDVAAAERLDEAWAQSVTDPGRTQAVPSPISMHPT